MGVVDEYFCVAGKELALLLDKISYQAAEFRDVDEAAAFGVVRRPNLNILGNLKVIDPALVDPLDVVEPLQCDGDEQV